MIFSRHTLLALLGAATLCLGTPVVHAQTATVGANFSGLDLNATVGFTPPDTMGAMGLNNQFAEFINGGFALYNTTTGTRESAISDGQFWKNAGLGGNAEVAAENLSDTRILFDSATDRWFASELTTPTNTNSNQFLVAVSNTADASQGFKGYVFNANPASGSQNFFADFDMLGVNNSGVYLGDQNFNTSGVGVSTSLLAISKSDLLGEVAAPASNLFYNLPDAQLGNLPHPVTDLDLPGSANYMPDVEYTLSPSASTFGKSALASLNGSGSNPPGLVITSGGDNVNNPGDAAFSPSASEPGKANSIQTNDDRYDGAVIKKLGYLWGVQDVANGAHAGLLWSQVDPTTGKVVNSGILGDSTSDYYFGSIAVNDSGDIVIGYTRSGATLDPSTFASVGKLASGVVTFGNPLLLHQSTTPYTGFDLSPYRWGDYSNTVVDPSDPSDFWTIQEYSGGGSDWATQISEITVSDNASPTPEPSQAGMMALMGLGLGGLLLRARRKSRA